MRSRILVLKENPLIRYLFIGGLSYAIEIILIFGLIQLGVGSVLSVGISFWFGLIVSFALQKLIAFRDRQVHPKYLLKQTIGYIVLVLVNYTFTLAFIALFETHLTLLIARTIALIITVCWNYFVYKKILFKSQ